MRALQACMISRSHASQPRRVFASVDLVHFPRVTTLIFGLDLVSRAPPTASCTKYNNNRWYPRVCLSVPAPVSSYSALQCGRHPGHFAHTTSEDVEF